MTRLGRSLLLASTTCLVVIAVAGCTPNSLEGSPKAQPTASSASMQPTPTTLPSTRYLGRSTPVRITIPSISVHSAVMRLGLQANDTLQVPPGAFPAGWYTGSPTPGQQGPSVIVGHVHWNGRLGVFARLDQLRPGAVITIKRADGTNVRFAVTTVRLYPKNRFPTALVYGNVSGAELRLITCGRYDRVAHKYEANLVVFARLL